MIGALLLAVSLAHGQSLSTAPASAPIEDLQIANMGKAIRSLESGRPRITGKPTYANGICFGDATCQTTAFTRSGLLLQFVSSMTSGAHSIALAIPSDNTIPQISEGDQVIVATITPVAATSRIRIEGVFNVVEETNGSGYATACIFRDATADAIACFNGLTMEQTASAIEQVKVDYILPATDTTQRNYSVRIGNGSANVLTVNTGQAGAARYGGTITSSLFLSEISQ